MAHPRVTSTQQILAAAAEVFSEKGYTNATLDDVARAAGVSKPTLYKYSKSKQWMLDSIVKQVQGALSETVPIENDVPGLERLRQLALRVTRLAAEIHIFYEVSVNDTRELSEDASEAYQEWMRSVTKRTKRILEQCREEGSLDLTGNITIYANLWQSMMRGIFRWYDPEGKVTPEELADHMISMLGSLRDGREPLMVDTSMNTVRQQDQVRHVVGFEVKRVSIT